MAINDEKSGAVIHGRCGHLFIIGDAEERQADDRDFSQQIYDADGIFMPGGDQRRLVEILGGTRVHDAMCRAFKERAACIGGTSAGAAAIARHMLAYGKQ